MRALCFCIIMISHLVFFHNHMIFQRPQIVLALRALSILLVFEKFAIYTEIALEIM